MTEMPDSGLRNVLHRLVTVTEAHRDRALAESIATDDSHEQANWRGRWSGHALTLSALHEFTAGEFGEPYEQQLSPFTEDERREPGGTP